MLYLARIIKFRTTKSQIATSSNDQIDKIQNKLLSDSVIAVAGEMSWGGVRAFGLHIQRSNSNCSLFGAASKLATHCLIGEIIPISRLVGNAPRSYEYGDANHMRQIMRKNSCDTSRSQPEAIDRSENYSAFDLCLLEIA